MCICSSKINLEGFIRIDRAFWSIDPFSVSLLSCVDAAGGGGRALQAGDNVTFVMAVQTSAAWVAMGLSRDGTGMKGMDVALLRREEVCIILMRSPTIVSCRTIHETS